MNYTSQSQYTKRCSAGHETYADIKLSCQELKKDELEHKKALGLEKVFIPKFMEKQ